MKVFFDASVIIAALLSPSGGSAKIIELGKAGSLHLVTSQTVIGEVINNSTKIKKSEKQINNFISQNNILVREQIRTSEIEPFFNIVESKDAHILAGAISTKCTHLATLDKRHLLKPQVKKFLRPIKTGTPKEILEEML